MDYSLVDVDTHRPVGKVLVSCSLQRDGELTKGRPGSMSQDLIDLQWEAPEHQREQRQVTLLLNPSRNAQGPPTGHADRKFEKTPATIAPDPTGDTGIDFPASTRQASVRHTPRTPEM